MAPIWGGIRDDIDKLEASSAPLNEWKKSTSEYEAVRSLAALTQATQGLELSGAERAALPGAFNSSASVFHFGYECNYHALVFFDSASKAWKVIKW